MFSAVWNVIRPTATRTASRRTSIQVASTLSRGEREGPGRNGRAPRFSPRWPTRSVARRSALGGELKHVPRAAYRAQHRLVAIAVELPSKVRHVDIDDIGLVEGDRRLSPDVLHDRRAGDRVAGVAHEILEQGELPLRESEPPLATVGLAGDRVEDEI